MGGINARQARQPNLHRFERRHFIVERPFVIPARDRLDFAFFVRFDFDISERENPLLPAVQGSDHKVAVVELQPRVELVDPSSPTHEIDWAEHGYFEDGTRGIQPQIGPLGKPRAQLRGLFVSGFLQMQEFLVVS